MRNDVPAAEWIRSNYINGRTQLLQSQSETQPEKKKKKKKKEKKKKYLS
jgi:hypothetical protein